MAENCVSLKDRLEQELTASLKIMLAGKVDQATLNAYVTEVAQEELKKMLGSYQLREAIQKIVREAIEVEGNIAVRDFLKLASTKELIKTAAEGSVTRGIERFTTQIEENLSNAL